MSDPNTDEQLFRRAQSSSDGFGELFDAYYERVYAYAYRRIRTRQIAEDIAACTFEDALKGIDRIRWQGKPIIAWLFRIASRRIADHMRRPELLRLDEHFAGSPSEIPGQELERQERRLAVSAAIDKLGKADKDIIQLTYFDELEASEIAAILGITKNTLYVRHHRALSRLEALVKAQGV